MAKNDKYTPSWRIIGRERNVLSSSRLSRVTIDIESNVAAPSNTFNASTDVTIPYDIKYNLSPKNCIISVSGYEETKLMLRVNHNISTIVWSFVGICAGTFRHRLSSVGKCIGAPFWHGTVEWSSKATFLESCRSTRSNRLTLPAAPSTASRPGAPGIRRTRRTAAAGLLKAARAPVDC